MGMMMGRGGFNFLNRSFQPFYRQDIEQLKSADPSGSTDLRIFRTWLVLPNKWWERLLALSRR